MQCKRKYTSNSFIFCLIVLVLLAACQVKKYTMTMPQVKLKGKSTGYGPVKLIPISLKNFKKENFNNKTIYTLKWINCQPECRYMFNFQGSTKEINAKDSVYLIESNDLSRGRNCSHFGNTFTTSASSFANKTLQIKLVCRSDIKFTIDTCHIIIFTPGSALFNK